MKTLKVMVFLATICGLTIIFSSNVRSAPFRVSDTDGWNHRLMRTTSSINDLYVVWVEDNEETDEVKNILKLRHADVSGWVPEWDDPIRVAELPESINQGDVQICQGASGEAYGVVYISWFDGEGLYLVYSNNYGVTWSDQIQIDTEANLYNVVDEDYASVVDNSGIYEMKSNERDSVYFLYRIGPCAWAFKVLNDQYGNSYTSFNNGSLRYMTMCCDKNYNVYILNLKDITNGFRLTFYRSVNNGQNWFDEQLIYQIPNYGDIIGKEISCYYPRIACNDSGHVVIAWTWEGGINGVNFNQIMFQHSEAFGFTWLNTPSVISGINDYIELYADGLIAYIVLYWERSAYLYKVDLVDPPKNIPVIFQHPLATGGYKNDSNNLLFSSVDNNPDNKLDFVYFKKISGSSVVPCYNSDDWLQESEDRGTPIRHKEINLSPIDHVRDICIQNNVFQLFALWSCGTTGSREEGVYLKYSDNSGETWQGDGIVSEEIYESVKNIIKDVFDESEDNSSGILDGTLDKFGQPDKRRTYAEGTMNGEQGNDYGDTLINIIYGRDEDEHRGNVKDGSFPNSIQPGGVTTVEDDEKRDINQAVKDFNFKIDDTGSENDSWDIYDNFRPINDGSSSSDHPDEENVGFQVPDVRAISIGRDEEEDDSSGPMFDPSLGNSNDILVCDKAPINSDGNNSGININNEELSNEAFRLINISDVSRANHTSKDVLQNGVFSPGSISVGAKLKITKDGEKVGGIHIPEQETRRENGSGDSTSKHISSRMPDNTNRSEKGKIMKRL